MEKCACGGGLTFAFPSRNQPGRGRSQAGMEPAALPDVPDKAKNTISNIALESCRFLSC